MAKTYQMREWEMFVKKEMEMMATLEKNEREHQHQIEQLKSEARISQMEQQLLEVRAYTSQAISINRPTIQHNAAVDHAPQRDTELLLLQRIQEQMEEKERELKLKATAPAIQPMTIPNEDITPLQALDASHKTTTLQRIPHKSAVVPHTSQIVPRQASQISSLQAPKPNVPSATNITPSRSTQQQHQMAAALPQGGTKTAQGRPVPLPADSDDNRAAPSDAPPSPPTTQHGAPPPSPTPCARPSALRPRQSRRTRGSY